MRVIHSFVAPCLPYSVSVLTMKITHYIALPETEQVDILCRRGIRLSCREQDGHVIMLYGVNDFYVEVYYHRSRASVTALHAFASTDGLDAYLEEIDVSDLFIS